MLLINCPWCGERNETEFSYGGEAGITRPPEPSALSDAEWADYLFMRSNPRGAHKELWNHSQAKTRFIQPEKGFHPGHIPIRNEIRETVN